METKSIDDLKPDPKNPRTLSEQDGQALQKSLDKFGDLGCVVFNVRTQQLVGGHQRLQIMKRLPGERRVMITERAGEDAATGREFLDDAGTKAIGYIFIGNKQFAYREVDWDEGTQRAANIAANRISGTFDLDLLAEVNYELSQLDNGDELLELTGQSPEELDNLMKATGAGDDDDPQDSDGLKPLSVRLTEQQLSTVLDAIGLMKRQRTLTNEPNRDLDGNALFYVCEDFLTHQEPSDAPPAADAA